MGNHAKQIARGKRFEFGENWWKFLSKLDDTRISEAERSLKEMLGIETLTGQKFLDIGSGSGLFSLAARRLGASVHSFDCDPKSVACTKELRRRFYPNDPKWSVEEASILDRQYIEALGGKFDIVYSWGVLHHTGNLKQALENAVIPVASKGLLYIAIYNEHTQSKFWTRIKKIYCSGWFGRLLTSAIFIPYFALQAIATGLIVYQHPFKQFSEHKRKRGMSIYNDWVDWLGGYPFEVAKPEEIFQFIKQAGFVLQKMTTTNWQGCNEFVFQKQ